MIVRRALAAGIITLVSHVSGDRITVYLLNGGLLEYAQQMAAHESARTTKLYDRRNDQVTSTRSNGSCSKRRYPIETSYTAHLCVVDNAVVDDFPQPKDSLATLIDRTLANWGRKLNIATIFSTIATCAGIGALIDFYIGKDGQKKTKLYLEEWWYRLSYMSLTFIGKEELKNTIAILDALFGVPFFSRRRWRSAVVFKILSLCIYPGLYCLVSLLDGIPIRSGQSIQNFLDVVADIIFINISVSITRAIITRSIRLFSADVYVNMSITIALFMLQFIVLTYALPITFSIMQSISSSVPTAVFMMALGESFSSIINGIMQTVGYSFHLQADVYLIDLNPVTRFIGIFSFPTHPFAVMNHHREFVPNLSLSRYFDTLFVNIGRWVLAFMFFISYLVVLAWPKFLTLWARVIESDKPVFTILGTGVGGLAGGIAALLK